MKKLSEEHYIICDDSEIKEGDFVYSSDGGIFKRYIDNHCQTVFPISKVTHSTQPLGFLNVDGFTTANLKPDWTNVEYLPLSEVKELLGIVDVEKKAKYYYGQNRFTREYEDGFMLGFKLAYNQALEDNKEKKYTETDIKNAIIRAYSMMGNTIDVGYFNEVIQSLQPKTEWEVEIVDGKLKLKS